jgi:rubrerythrin
MSDHPVSTGVADHVYDLVLLMQQACEDVVRYERFAEDAEQAGDKELSEWLRELADSDREIAARAREMLKRRL